MSVALLGHTSDPDLVAKRLLEMGNLARSMPPSWDGAKFTSLAAGPGGEYIGKMLPGRGLYLDMDFKHLGITKQIPNVYERTRFRRILDRLNDEVGAITTYDGIIAARAGGKAEDIAFTKASITTVAAFWYDATWRAAGQPGAGTYLATTPPTNGARNKSNPGALNLALTNPVSGEKKYLLTFGYTAVQQINMAILADLHVDAGIFRTGVTTAETVAAPVAVVRQYGPGPLGAGCLIIFIVTTARGTPAAGVCTVTYVDQDGNTGITTTYTPSATADPVDRFFTNAAGSPFIPLAAGDYGVRSVSQHQRAATADASGAVALNIYTPLAFVPGIAANMYVERDSTIQIDGLTELALDSAGGPTGALKVYVLPNTTSTGQMTGFIRTASG